MVEGVYVVIVKYNFIKLAFFNIYRYIFLDFLFSTQNTIILNLLIWVIDYSYLLNYEFCSNPLIFFFIFNEIESQIIASIRYNW